VREPAGGAPTIDAGGGPAAHKEADLARHLEYDDLRRASLTAAWFDDTHEVAAVSPWSRARFMLAGERLETTLEQSPDGLVVSMRTRDAAMPIDVEVRLVVRDATVDAQYRLRTRDRAPLRGLWAVQWNVALTAGDAPDRYLDLPERPSLGSSGRQHMDHLVLVDEWIGVEARIDAEPATEIAWGPVETVSVSEGGFERIYQGTALTLAWRFDGDRTNARVGTKLQVASR
jgi:4-alpha-glucanotransferase